MKDEFWVLRPVILFSAGFLMLGIVLHACREAAEQRARFAGQTLAGAANDPAMKATTAFRVFPPASLPGGIFEQTVPAAY